MESVHDTAKYVLLNVANNLIKFLGSKRVSYVPVLNWAMIAIYFGLLLKLSLNFRRFYAIFSLGTTALTNLLLYGLADTLAQTLRNVAQSQMTQSLDPTESPFFSYILHHGRQRRVVLDEEGDDLAELGLANSTLASPAPALDMDGEEEKVFDFRRLYWFSVYGCMVSFVQSPWYAFLNIAYNRDAKFIAVVQRVLADQLFYSPIMLIVFMTYMTLVVEQGDASDVKRTLMTRYIPTLGVNLCVWPAAQFINFLIIPSNAQIPFSSSLSVLWNTYLSLNTG